MLAYTAGTWTQVIVAISIFVPVAIAAVLTVVILRGKKNDPDEQRLRRAQDDYNARRKAEQHDR